jgi:hypothetical protein
MTLVTKALDPFSEVVDEDRRWTPEWYSFIATVNRVGKVVDLPAAPPTDPALPKPVVFATLGDRAFVIDAASIGFGNVVTSGGTNAVPVYFDGAVWRVG